MPVLSKSKLRASQPAALYVPAPGGGGGGATWTAPTAHVTLSGGNLIATATSGVTSGDAARSTTSHASGKYYFEATCNDASGGTQEAGLGAVATTFSLGSGYLGGGSGESIAFYLVEGKIFYNNAIAFIIAPFTTGDVICVALDVTNSKIWFRINGAFWMGATGSDPTDAGDPDGIALTPALTWYAACDFEGGAGTSWTINFSGSYAFTKPSGYSNW